MRTKINNAYGVGGPIIPVFPIPIDAQRAPINGIDVEFPQGQTWWNNGTSPRIEYTYNGDGTWSTISIPSGTVVSVTGTANQVTSAPTFGAVVLTIPATFIAPGSIASTTTLAAGTNATVGGTLGVTGATTLTTLAATSGTFSGNLGVTGTLTTGTLALTNLAVSGTLGVTGLSTLGALTQVGTASINGSGAAVTTIGTGGTGAVNIGNATGNTAVTGSLTATTTITAGTGITSTTGNISATAGVLVGGTGVVATTGNIVATAGNITASLGGVSAATTVVSGGTITAATGITNTAGSITASNGNFVLGTAGNKQIYISVGGAAAAGANSAGTVALIGGTITVATTAITAASQVRLTCQALGTVTVPSALACTAKTTGISFVILASQATDTSTIFWEIVN